MPDPVALTHACRKEQVKLFFTTQKAAEAEQQASKKLENLRATLER